VYIHVNVNVLLIFLEEIKMNILILVANYYLY